MKQQLAGTLEEDRSNAKPTRDTQCKNIVVFGESGVGKSSLINLIAGERVSETSSGALGCTLEYKRYPLDLEDQRLAIWDTAGLDEGAQGSVPADKAEAYLKQLLHELAKNNGIDLLVYCVRGTRVRTALLTNYHIFYSAICRKKVPIAIVITGLENQEGSMETWWYRNESQFSQLKMHFDGHACVTTLESSIIENPLLKERREISRKLVIEMITSTCRAQQWKPPERGWVESAYSDIRAMLSPRDGHGVRLATIIMCDTTRERPRAARSTRKRSISFQAPIALPSLHSFSFRSPWSSNNTFRSKLPFEESIKHMPERLHRVYQVSPIPLPLPENSEEETGKASVVKRGADLLIFCAGMKEEFRTIKFQWEHFRSTYGGDLSPQIVLILGAASQSTAEEWWREVVGEVIAKNDLDVAHWPLDVTGNEVDVARLQLQHLISDRCIDCSKARLTRDEKLFRRSLFLDIANLATRWAKTEGTVDESPVEQDVLTKVGVWYDIPERSPSLVVLPQASPI